MIHLAAFRNGVIVEEIKFSDASQIDYWKHYLLGLAGLDAKVYRKT